MTTARLTADTGTASRTGLYLAALQLVFTLGWTTYVIYLPKLAAEVGIAPSAVILILMLDQAIFTIADTAMGIAADRLAPYVGRLGLFVGLVAAISCGAFVAMPFVAGVGAAAQVWLIALVDHLVCLAGAAADLARQISCAAAGAVPRRSRDARLRRCRRCLALSRRGHARA
jgi:hypothetical protein